MSNILLDVNTALITLLKSANTLAGNNVREGLTIPLDNQYTDFFVPDSKKMPLIVVQNKRVSYKMRSKAEYGYECLFQIDGYIKQDLAKAESNGIEVDEQVNRDLDTLALQVQNAIQFYANFRQNSVIPELNLRYIAELEPSETVKNQVDQTSDLIIGSNSMTVMARFSDYRQFETIDDLKIINSELQNGRESDIIKEIQTEV